MEAEHGRLSASLERGEYVAPAVETLGTLEELTRGGVVGIPDGVGMAGSTGSI